MDPITMIVAALVAGATAGLTSTVETVVKDAYAGLKTLIQRKYGSVSLAALEQKPDSETQRAAVAEHLAVAGAGADQELLDQAKALLDAIKAHAPKSAAAIGIDWEKIEAEYLKMKKVTATAGGTGFRLKEGKFPGGIEIDEVSAGEPAKKS